MSSRALILILALFAQDAMARQSVASLKPLLVEALRKGSAEGILSNPDAKAFSQTFGSTAPILIDVVRIGSHQEAGCGRLRVTTSQTGVVERDQKGTALPAKDQRMVYQINYCESGRFLVLLSNPNAYWLDDYSEMIEDYPVDLPYRSYGPE